MLSLPASSVKLAVPTSMVTAPSAAGVKVAVYTVEDVAAKLLNAPLVTVISPTADFYIHLLLPNISASVESLDVNPSAPSAAVIVMVGGVVS